ncbi:MAG: TonB-dependent receptor, partial [Acidobacteria bacterium]|nr:TonB-dependent receptor [Acidobacteriota bacterium]
MEIRRVVFACLLMLFGAASILGQSYQGGIRGAVNDPGGAVIPGVQVVLINEGTNVSRETVTNETGQYVFAAVAPGTYRLRATLPGFKTYERSGVNIGVQQFVTLDINMEVGAVTEEIAVVADAPLIETSTANTSTALPQAMLSTLPNTGRNAFMIALTVPTVVHVGNPFYVRQQDQTNATRVSLGGGPVRGNNYLIEGVPVTDWRNRTVIFPNIESVAEVKVQVNTYDAEMGRTGGGVFNTTMRSGTNEWHGSAHVQQRPDEWGAANFFDNRAGRKPLPYYYWLWGGSGGGPIAKDKTFFWASTEGYKTGTNWTGSFTVPTALEKSGDFSQTRDRNGNPVIIYDPLTTRPDPANPGRFIRDPFPGNRIPANRLNATGRALVGFMPAPTDAGSAGGVNNFTSSDTLIDRAYQYTAKLDHTFNTMHSVSGSYAYYDSAEPFAVYYRGTSGEIADGNNSKLFRTVHAPVVNYTLTPDHTTVITLRYGYNWFKDTCVPASADFDLSQLGLNPSFVSTVQQKVFPSIGITDYRGLGGQGNIDIEWWSQNFLGNYSKFIGRHNFRFGGAYRQLGVDFFDRGNVSGTFSFSKAFTQQDPDRAATTSGNAIASLLLGIPASGSVSVGTPLSYFTRYYAGYVQDDFRITSTFTLNYGLRFEHETDMREKNNQTTVGFDRNATSPIAARVTDASLRDRIKGGLLYAGKDGAQTHQANPQSIKLGPRVGFAWTAR